MRMTTAMFLAGLLVASPALAEKRPQPGPVDSRIRTVVYNPRDVVRVLGHYGFQTLIKFADYETIEDIAPGDSLAWQIVTNERRNLLWVKPVEQDAQTNLTIVTSLPSPNGDGSTKQRVYIFALHARAPDDHQNPNFTWKVVFQYPEDAMQALLRKEQRRRIADNAIIGHSAAGATFDPADLNFNYTFAGDRSQVPVKIFDNGTFTYFEFDKVTDTPAIFLVGKDQQESLVNGVRQGRYMVVHRVARQFTLRNGDVVTCIFNEAFSGEPALDQSSPIQRSEYLRAPGPDSKVARRGLPRPGRKQ